MQHNVHLRLAGMAVCSALLVTPERAAAQKPEVRETHSVRGHLTTPARRDFEMAKLRTLKVPAGFTVSVFAAGLGAPRMMAVGEDGTVYVTRRDSGDVVALIDRDGNGRAEDRRTVVSNLAHVHGITIDGSRM